MFTSRNIQTLFQISHETVRTWSAEFVDFLSPTANPPKGKHRTFTERDLEVFALIAEMKKRGAIFDDIRASLAAGERGDAPVSEANMLALAERDRQLAEISTQIELLRSERDEALRQLRPMQDENIRLRTQLEMLRVQIDELKNQQSGDAAIQAKLAAAERELELWRSGRLKPEDE